MLSEEAVLLVACLAVTALVIIALLEVVWPSRARHPRARVRYRRPHVTRSRDDRPAYRRTAPEAREAAPRSGSPTPRRVEEAPPEAIERRGESVFARAVLSRGAPPPAPDPDPPPEALAAAPAPPAPAPAPVPAGPAPRPSADRGPADSSLPLEECFSLYQDKRYADVIARAAQALERDAEAGRRGPTVAHEVAALWSVTGLSRQALDDEEGARAAFEAAIHAAPASERPTYERHLAALAHTVARQLIARADTLPDVAGAERSGALRQAVRWLRQALASAPNDATLQQALARACAGLWDSYGQFARALIQRQEFPGARRVIREALAEDGFPEERREAFSDLLAATFSGEIGQLTAHAIRVMQDEHEREALASLERAEALLASVPTETLTPKRREEVNRRLWWGYTKLGARRVASGEYEDAVEPLFHALRLSDANPEQQDEARAALVQALDGVAEARAESIGRLLKTGDRDAAARESDRLRRLLLEGIELGLTKNELTSALTRTRRVFEQVKPSP
jgi:tetratricopeptide (TPR) repeat protein